MRKKMNESQLRSIIKESLTEVIDRIQNDNFEGLEDDDSAWGGIDDYPDAPSAEDQWKGYREAQGLENDYPYDKWKEERDRFEEMPHYYSDTDSKLDDSFENGFQRDDKLHHYGMHALDPESTYARDQKMFNGWDCDDPNNPGALASNRPDYTEDLPEEYLNESVKRALRNTLRKYLY